MDLDKYEINRTVYTSLDMLGDIGGLLGILFDIGSILIMFITGNGLNYLLISHIFKEETDTSFEHSQGFNSRLKQLSDRKPVSKKFRIRICDLLCRRCLTTKLIKNRLERGEERF